MEIHYSKHHAGYIANLNKALVGTDLSQMPVEKLLQSLSKIPAKIKQTVINNAGGHANHSLYWDTLSPNGGGEPKGKLKKAIEGSFKSFENFKTEFEEKALSLFGSGWVFLQIEGKKLAIKRHSFQNSPLMHGIAPIMGVDVWEHAYYLKYQNRRNEYISAMWNIIDWSAVEKRYAAA